MSRGRETGRSTISAASTPAVKTQRVSDNRGFRHCSVEFDLNSKSYTLYCRQDSTGNSRTKPQIKRQFMYGTEVPPLTLRVYVRFGRAPRTAPQATRNEIVGVKIHPRLCSCAQHSVQPLIACQRLASHSLERCMYAWASSMTSLQWTAAYYIPSFVNAPRRHKSIA